MSKKDRKVERTEKPYHALFRDTLDNERLSKISRKLLKVFSSSEEDDKDRVLSGGKQ